jgi:hypothetical protein
MLTQIYEISSPDEARAVAGIGIDHIGVLVGDGEFTHPNGRRRQRPNLLDPRAVLGALQWAV